MFFCYFLLSSESLIVARRRRFESRWMFCVWYCDWVYYFCVWCFVFFFCLFLWMNVFLWMWCVCWLNCFNRSRRRRFLGTSWFRRRLRGCLGCSNFEGFCLVWVWICKIWEVLGWCICCSIWKFFYSRLSIDGRRVGARRET